MAAVSMLALVAGCTSLTRQPPAAPAASAAAPVQAKSVSAPAPAPAKAEWPENPSLQDYLDYAVAHNPGLASAYDQWKAAMERVPQARSLDDPRVSYRVAVARMMRTHEVAVEQMLPWFGKLDLRAAVAVEEANAAHRRAEVERLKLEAEVKNAYYEYYYLSRSIAVVRENLTLVKYLEEVALVRYRTASAGHPDVIRSQVELGKLDDDLRTLEDSRGSAAARLNAMLNRPAEAPLPWPAAIREEPVDVPDEQVLAWMRETSPELKGLGHDIARERQAIELARKDFYPDIGVGVGYMNFREIDESQNGHMVVGMVSVTLPIWRDKYAAGVREAESRHQAALKSRADRENRLAAEAKMAAYQLRDAHRKIGLYRDNLVPKARQSLEATLAAYRAGSVPFADLVDAERLLLEFQLDYERALANHGQRLAELERIVGRELPRGSAPSAPAPESPK